MEKHQITYQGVTYDVKEPTLEQWTGIMSASVYKTDFELAVSMLSIVTGLDEAEIQEASASSIINAADGLVEYYSSQAVRFYDTFTFNDKNYKFIDLPNMTFGEYIDIDDILNLPSSVKNTKMHLLLAMFYREVDDKGRYLPYDVDRIKKTSEEFRKLPVRYLHGASVFFYNIQTTLEKNTPLYLWEKNWWILQTRLIKRKITGGGIQRLFTLHKRIYYVLKTWLKKTILKYSTF